MAHVWLMSAQSWAWGGGDYRPPGLSFLPPHPPSRAHKRNSYGVGLRDACFRVCGGGKWMSVASDKSSPFLGLIFHTPSEGSDSRPHTVTLFPHPLGHLSHSGADCSPPPGPCVGCPGAVWQEHTHQVQPPQLLPKGTGSGVTGAPARDWDIRAPALQKGLSLPAGSPGAS